MIRRGSLRLCCVVPDCSWWWFSEPSLGGFLGVFSGPCSWGFDGGNSCEPFAVLLPLIPLSNPQVKGLDCGVFGVLGLEVFLRVDFWFILIEWVLGTELLAKGSPQCTPTIPKVSLWSVERIGWSIGGRVEFFPRAVFFPTIQAKTGLTGFTLWAVEKGFRARKSLLRYGFFCLDVERLLRCFGFLGSFWTKSVWPVCPLNRSGLTGFRKRPDRFGLPAAMSCVFPLRVCCGCWLGLAPRFSSTLVAAWTWQEKLAEVNEWNRVHRPNSWIEFLSAPIHSPLLSGSPFRSFRHLLVLEQTRGYIFFFSLSYVQKISYLLWKMIEIFFDTSTRSWRPPKIILPVASWLLQF
jgi:hypothetical protein